MPHAFEVAPTGRAKCRACGATIAKGELRFGERSPNPYGEGEMTQWFHPTCAAFKRAEPLLEALPEAPEHLEDKAGLEARARATLEHRRLERVDGAERSPTAQAKCRHCRERIERGAWRIRLTLYESDRFSPGGFVHLTCYPAYFEGHEVLDRIQHFSPGLEDADRMDLEQSYRSVPKAEPS
ncbi:MAG TPA: PARP-type zinc finger-containing protein [Candidatus Eisenbacteria bacterium]|nr:PARP-type zinc finger-containing protein [Candidatus Eisenbacteria bacterium]